MKRHYSLLSFGDVTKGLNIDAFPSHLSPTPCMNKQGYVVDAPNLSRSGEQNCCAEHTALIPTRLCTLRVINNSRAFLSSPQGHYSEGIAPTERSSQRWAHRQHTSQTRSSPLWICGHLRPVKELQLQPKKKRNKRKKLCLSCLLGWIQPFL